MDKFVGVMPVEVTVNLNASYPSLLDAVPLSELSCDIRPGLILRPMEGPGDSEILILETIDTGSYALLNPPHA